MRLTDRRSAYYRQRYPSQPKDGILAMDLPLTPAQRRRLAKKERRAIAQAKRK